MHSNAFQFIQIDLASPITLHLLCTILKTNASKYKQRALFSFVKIKNFRRAHGSTEEAEGVRRLTLKQLTGCGVRLKLEPKYGNRAVRHRSVFTEDNLLRRFVGLVDRRRLAFTEQCDHMQQIRRRIVLRHE